MLVGSTADLLDELGAFPAAIPNVLARRPTAPPAALRPPETGIAGFTWPSLAGPHHASRKPDRVQRAADAM